MPAAGVVCDVQFQDDFHVENFVVECRRKVQLEMLRNDLHVYLKILQSAMVELINKDYADFVNLSTNLVCCCSHCVSSISFWYVVRNISLLVNIDLIYDVMLFVITCRYLTS